MSKALGLAAALIVVCAGSAHAFKDIECKANREIMITQPGSYERVVTLVNQKKVAAAQKLLVCMIDKGRGVFIVGKPKHGKESFVPVSTGDCIGETYRPHLTCPGDKPPRKAKAPAKKRR